MPPWTTLAGARTFSVQRSRCRRGHRTVDDRAQPRALGARERAVHRRRRRPQVDVGRHVGTVPTRRGRARPPRRRRRPRRPRDRLRHRVPVSGARPVRCPPDGDRPQPRPARHRPPLSAAPRHRVPADRGERRAAAAQGPELRPRGQRVRGGALVRSGTVAARSRPPAAPGWPPGVPHQQRARRHVRPRRCRSGRRPPAPPTARHEPDRLVRRRGGAPPGPRRVDPRASRRRLRRRRPPRAVRVGRCRDPRVLRHRRRGVGEPLAGRGRVGGPPRCRDRGPPASADVAVATGGAHRARIRCPPGGRANHELECFTTVPFHPSMAGERCHRDDPRNRVCTCRQTRGSVSSLGTPGRTSP